MNTTQTTYGPGSETPEEAKARRNAEYLAKIDGALQEIKTGRGVTMTFEEWEKKFCNE